MMGNLKATIILKSSKIHKIVKNIYTVRLILTAVKERCRVKTKTENLDIFERDELN